MDSLLQSSQRHDFWVLMGLSRGSVLKHPNLLDWQSMHFGSLQSRFDPHWGLVGIWEICWLTPQSYLPLGIQVCVLGICTNKCKINAK